MIFWLLLISCTICLIFLAKKMVIEFSRKATPNPIQVGDNVEAIYYDFKDRLHREDGPAVEYKKGHHIGYPYPEGYYYIHGKSFTKEEFLKRRAIKRIKAAQKLSLPKLVIALTKKLRK
jgi:hypothetical protein